MISVNVAQQYQNEEISDADQTRLPLARRWHIQDIAAHTFFRRWPIAIITTLAVIVLQRGTPALSRASITQGEAASITAHGGSATLQECMALWDEGTHMSKAEWKSACKRTMVLEFPANAP